MNRRNFLGSLAAVGLQGSAVTLNASSMKRLLGPRRNKKASMQMDSNLVVFISDMHVKPAGYEGEKLKRVVDEILRMSPLPGNVIGLGDLSNLYGRVEDYEAAKPILQPLEDAGIRLTLAMGNHDRRESFARVFPEKAASTRVPGRMVYIVETPRVDFIVLDSLDQSEDATRWITPGTLDEGQRKWLATTLQSYTKPVIVCAHHPIHETRVTDLIAKNPTCCGYIHGHDHRWRVGWSDINYSTQDILRTLCLPSTGFWGDIGYTIFRQGEYSATATLVMLEYFYHTPLREGEEKPLQWKLIEQDNKGACCRFSCRRAWRK